MVLLIVWFTTIEQDSLVSVCITGTFLYVFWGILIRNKELDRRLYIIALFCVFISFVNVNISSFGNFDYYKKLIMFSTSIFWIVYCFSIRLNKSTLDIVFFVNILIGIVFIISLKNGFGLYDGEILLTFNFPNPNQAGMFLLNTMLYITLLILSNKSMGYNIIIKGLSLLILTILFFLLYLTGCRSSIGAYVFFILFCIADKLRFNFYKKYFFVFFSIAPLLFVFLYLNYINLVNIDLSFGMDTMGKSSLTRLGVWRDAVNMLEENFIFGDYSNVKNYIKYSQAHNTHLDVWISYGFIPFLLFVAIIYKSTWRIYTNTSFSFQRYSLLAFITCLVNGFFESALVVGSAGLFLLCFGFLLLSRVKLDKVTECKC